MFIDNAQLYEILDTMDPGKTLFSPLDTMMYYSLLIGGIVFATFMICSFFYSIYNFFNTGDNYYMDNSFVPYVFIFVPLWLCFFSPSFVKSQSNITKDNYPALLQIINNSVNDRNLQISLNQKNELDKSFSVCLSQNSSCSYSQFISVSKNIILPESKIENDGILGLDLSDINFSKYIVITLFSVVVLFFIVIIVLSSLLFFQRKR